MAAPAIQARRGARPRTALLVALPAALILLGALMRVPVLLTYQGPLTAHALNVDLMAHVGAYSDISHLFFRDHLGQHPMPYFDFRFEYPVLTGLFVWVASFAHTSVAAYFLSSTGLLVVSGPGDGLGDQSNRRGQPVAFRSRAGARPLRNPELGPAGDLPARHRAASLRAGQGRIRRGEPRSRYLGQVLPNRRPPGRRRPPPGRRATAFGRPGRGCLHGDHVGGQPPVRAHRGRIDPRQLVLLLHLHGPTAPARDDLAPPARPCSGLGGGSAVRRRPGPDRDPWRSAPGTVRAAR